MKEQKEQVEEVEAAGGESSACREPEEGADPEEVDLLQDLRHIEEQMKVLLKEKEQTDAK